MIQGYIAPTRSRAQADGADVAVGALLSGVTSVDGFGRPILAAGDSVGIATDRPSSVLVQTSRGGYWLDPSGVATFTAPAALRIGAVHIRPPLSAAEKTAVSASLYPDTFTPPIEAEIVTYMGQSYRSQRPAPAAAQGLALNRQGGLRCELQPGWAWWRDATAGNINQRSELLSLDPLPFETDVWVSSPLLIEPGPATSAGFWSILGQVWAQEDPGETLARTPVFRQVYVDGALIIATCSDPAATSTVQPEIVPRWRIDNIQRGVWHNLVHRMRLSRTGTGHLQSWWNGTLMYDADIPFGYNDVAGHLWKFGIYRKPSDTDALVVRYRNVEQGTVDLSSRVANPLPVS